MTKGIIYIMTTVISGLIKIGKTGTKNYPERMLFLEANGYYNVAGLKRFFAIELEDYDDKEALLHEVFNKHRVGNSELFALDQDLVRQLLLSFDGTVIYPEKLIKKKNSTKFQHPANRVLCLVFTRRVSAMEMLSLSYPMVP